MLPATTSSTSPLAASTDRGLQVGAAMVIRKLMLRFPEFAERNPDRKAVVEEWAQELADMRPHEVQRGLSAASNSPYAPNIGDFRRLCRPALDPEWAWHEAQAGLQARARGEVGAWSHPAVFRAATGLRWELRTKTFAAARRQWEMVLSREFAAGWGGEVPEPALCIENKPVTRAMSREQRQLLIDLAKSFANQGKT